MEFITKDVVHLICTLRIQKILEEKDKLAPCNMWEKWILDNPQDTQTDIVSMCVVVIIMSSSTSDQQLAAFVPKILSLGVTSAIGICEI